MRAGRLLARAGRTMVDDHTAPRGRRCGALHRLHLGIGHRPQGVQEQACLVRALGVKVGGGQEAGGVLQGVVHLKEMLN